MNGLDNSIFNCMNSITKKNNEISKRDIFAIFAMCGLLSKEGRFSSPEKVAIDSYRMADAMITEGEKK